MKTRAYRPSNGTEGMLFDDRWCSRCVLDSDDNCEILACTLLYDIGDPQYPAEWIEDDVPYPQDSNPRCTAFLPIGTDLELEECRKDKRQMVLPL